LLTSARDDAPLRVAHRIMLASLASTLPRTPTASPRAVARDAARDRRVVRVVASASSASADSDRDRAASPRVVVLTRRGLAASLAALALTASSPSDATAATKFRARSDASLPGAANELAQLSEANLRYKDSTLDLIAETAAIVDGASTDVDAWLRRASEWNATAKDSYSPKTQGRSFLMTTKLVSYVRNTLATAQFQPVDATNPPFDVEKTREWIAFAEGFTTGALAGDEARAAFARATWGNYDKSAPLNRFGLCAFGETGGTRALGVNCDGY
jgi:hypothetical protein